MLPKGDYSGGWAGRGLRVCAGTSVSTGASAEASAGEITFRGRVIQDKDCLYDVNKAEKSIPFKDSSSCKYQKSLPKLQTH